MVKFVVSCFKATDTFPCLTVIPVGVVCPSSEVVVSPRAVIVGRLIVRLGIGVRERLSLSIRVISVVVVITAFSSSSESSSSPVLLIVAVVLSV